MDNKEFIFNRSSEEQEDQDPIFKVDISIKGAFTFIWGVIFGELFMLLVLYFEMWLSLNGY